MKRTHQKGGEEGALPRLVAALRRSLSSDWTVLMVLAISLLLLKLPVLGIPYHWDEIGIEVPAAVWLKDNGFNPVMGGVSNGHPPLGHYIVAASLVVLGNNPVSARLPILISAIISLFLAYRIGKIAYGTIAGLLGAAVLMFMPMFFSHSAISLTNSFLVPLFLAAIYFTLRRRLTWFIVSSTAMILVKEYAIILVACLSVFWAWDMLTRADEKQGHERRIFKSIALGLPFAVFGLWLISNKILYGWYIFPRFTFYLDLTSFAANAADVSYILFVPQLRFVLASISFLGIALVSGKSEVARRLEMISLASIVMIVLFYSTLEQGFMPRYLLFLFPLLPIMAFGTLDRMFSKPLSIHASVILAAILIPLFIMQWHGTRDTPGSWILEDNMEYADMVESHRQAAYFIEGNYPNSTVVSCWPVIYELGLPYTGYVREPLSVIDYEETRSVEGADIIYYARQSRQSACYSLASVAESEGYDLVKEISVNGKAVKIFAKG